MKKTDVSFDRKMVSHVGDQGLFHTHRTLRAMLLAHVPLQYCGFGSSRSAPGLGGPSGQGGVSGLVIIFTSLCQVLD